MTAPAAISRRRVVSGRQTEQELAPTITVYRDYARRFDGMWIPAAAKMPGDALLVRQHPATLGAQGASRRVSKGVTDYFGIWQTADGPRPIAFDVKSVQGAASFALGPKEQHQLAFLRQVIAHGGVGFFLLLDAKAGWAWMIHRATDLVLLGQGVRVRFCERSKGVPSAHLVTACQRQRFGTLPMVGYDFLDALRKAGA